ncbi:MAG: SDR family oxidoreductase [Candidatus Omnitrophota bacterium]|nr:SDR family oxidoreductase [Candidatus Omnitrophota bacterium]MDZ4242705.1 SDR family oxidoreductase [Candidatus Omnitrophota bacterium]
MGKTSQPQIILITGCSSGFGLLTAARLASKGHQVIATVRDLNKSGALRDEVKRKGGEVDIVLLDVTDKSSVQSALKDIAARYGFLDVLVNNAGYGIGGFFEDLTDEEIRQQMETNFFGAQNVTRAAIPLMRPRRKGKIINISSIAGFNGSPAFGAYNASKWALEGFSESLRHELKFFGIDVLLVEPGTYKTKIFYENARFAKNFRNEHSPYYRISLFLEKRVKDYVDDCHKDPEDVAELIERLINASRPSFRNIPDIESQFVYILKKFLPHRVFSAITRKILLQNFTYRP